MSKAFEMITESLNEIIEDFEKNDGKNLHRETFTEEKNILKNFDKSYCRHSNSEKFINDRVGNVTI